MSLLARALGFLSAVLIAIAASAFLWMLWNRPLLDFGSEAFNVTTEINFTSSGRWIATGGGIGVLAYAFGCLLVSVWPRRRRLIELRAGEHESIQIAPATLERELEDVVRQAGQVYDARVEVHPERNRNVALDLEVAIPPRVEVASVVADVQRRLATALAAQYGISMTRKPRIQVRYMDQERAPRHRGGIRQDERERETRAEPGR